MECLIFLAIGFLIIGLGLRVGEEVLKITAAFTGAIFLVWGIIIAPRHFLMLAELLAVIALFRICVSYCNCD